MKTPLLAAAALALVAFAAVPAAAQVNGVAVADPAIAVAGSQALQAGYQQIATTYQAQRTQIEQQQQQRVTLMRQFDTNNDGQLSDEERAAAQANTAALQQLQTLEQTMAQTQAPIVQARVYAVEQIALQLGAAVQQVVTQQNLQLVLNPTSVVYMADPVDVTDEVTTALNGLVPAVSTAVPQGWRPSDQVYSLYEQVQNILLIAQQQQAQAAQAQPAPAPVQGR